MRSRFSTAALLALAVAMLGVWMWAGGDGVDEQPGSQIRSPEVSIGDAESHRWTVLKNDADTNRADFPRSLIAADSQLCFGFERIDFGLPIRPSLARCVERETLRDLQEDSIASAFVIKTGLDTWHVIAFGSPIDEFTIVGDDNEDLAPDRIFLGDGVIVLRLANDIQIESMSWTVGRSRYLCRPAADVVDSGRFCS